MRTTSLHSIHIYYHWNHDRNSATWQTNPRNLTTPMKKYSFATKILRTVIQYSSPKLYCHCTYKTSKFSWIDNDLWNSIHHMIQYNFFFFSNTRLRLRQEKKHSVTAKYMSYTRTSGSSLYCYEKCTRMVSAVQYIYQKTATQIRENLKHQKWRQERCEWEQ